MKQWNTTLTIKRSIKTRFYFIKCLIKISITPPSLPGKCRHCWQWNCHQEWCDTTWWGFHRAPGVTVLAQRDILQQTSNQTEGKTTFFWLLGLTWLPQLLQRIVICILDFKQNWQTSGLGGSSLKWELTLQQLFHEKQDVQMAPGLISV